MGRKFAVFKGPQERGDIVTLSHRTWNHDAGSL